MFHLHDWFLGENGEDRQRQKIGDRDFLRYDEGFRSNVSSQASHESQKLRYCDTPAGLVHLLIDFSNTGSESKWHFIKASSDY